MSLGAANYKETIWPALGPNRTLPYETRQQTGMARYVYFSSPCDKVHPMRKYGNLQPYPNQWPSC